MGKVNDSSDKEPPEKVEIGFEVEGRDDRFFSNLAGKGGLDSASPKEKTSALAVARKRAWTSGPRLLELRKLRSLKEV